MIKGGNLKEGLSLLTVEAHICLSSPSECQEVRVRAPNQVGFLP